MLLCIDSLDALRDKGIDDNAEFIKEYSRALLPIYYYRFCKKKGW